MPCFINLPSRWTHENSAWIDWFVNGRIAPELGFDAESLSLSNARHENAAARYRDAGLACSVHLPFMGIDPGDPDPGNAATARDMLRRGAELARIYGAKHMVGHPYYHLGERGGTVDAGWVERSISVWSELSHIADVPLYLENTYETSPHAIAVLIDALQPLAKNGSNIGVCFDLGHWHAFAGKRSAEELDPWLDAFCPFALHLHLHDNHGDYDHHMGLGLGSVPFPALFAKLAERGKKVTATLEPHDVEAFCASIAYLAVHADIAASVAWERPQMDQLPLEEIQKNIVT